MSKSTQKIVYAILAIGVGLAFLGHGILGIKGQETFVALVTANYDQVLGGTMSTDTATSWVNVIGIVDVVLAVAFFGLAFAAVREHRVAYSRLALGLFGWAIVWGFLTALSRFTAVMNGAEVWDVVERGPNYLLPAALVYLIYRTAEAHKGVTPESRRDVPAATGTAAAAS